MCKERDRERASWKRSPELGSARQVGLNRLDGDGRGGKSIQRLIGAEGVH